jgi:hypothetical protein
MKYAQQTSVSVDSSRNEIERTLKRYGARQFAYATQENKALIMFEAKGKRIKFLLNLPDINERRFTHTESRVTRRTKEAQEKEHEQACRQKWRALALVIKAKLEAVESGISIFEEEFMANIVLPNGQTVGDYILPQVNDAYVNNTFLPMLNFGGVQ